MSTNGAQHSNGNIDRRLRRQSVLSSSNPMSDSLPIDCILVYDRTDSDRESDAENSPGPQNKKRKKSSDRRRRFEEYLSKKQRLVLQHVVSRMKIFNKYYLLD